MRVFDFPDPDHVHWGGHWVLADRGIYFVNGDTTQRPTIEFFDFNARRATRLLTLTGPYDEGSSFAVSPDGMWFLYSQRDFFKSEIMVTDVDR